MKDAGGHGSNGRGSYGNIDKNLKGPGKHVGYANGPWHINKAEGQYHAYEQNGTGYIRGRTLGDVSAQLTARDTAARAPGALATGGEKSAPVPTHDSMSKSLDRGLAMRMAGDGGHVPISK